MPDFNPRSFAARRPVATSFAALAVAATSVFALTVEQGGPARAGVVEAPPSVANSAPSFADVVSHVKPAVVSVKVNIEDAVAQNDEGDNENGLDQIPPEMQQFF